MIAIPAIDLREGRCVQLVGGEYDQEAVRLDDPVAMARQWIHDGFPRLHVVDLDAATGRGNNRDVIRDILREATVPVQVGGGLREFDDIERILTDGATWAVVGTRAIEDETWRTEAADRFPDQLIIAADVRERCIVTRGWTHTSALDVIGFMNTLGTLPIAGALVTAVHVEGQLQGTDLALMEEVADAATFPIIASGGVTSIDDMRALEHRGIAGAVIGMALYTGVLDARHLTEEFGA